MASHFYSLNSPGAGPGPENVTKATSTQAGNNVELRVDDAVTGDSKVDVLKALETLRNYIITDSAPA